MNRLFSYDLTILPSVCDSTGRLSVPGTFALFMDIATAHAETLGVGLRAMAQRRLFWLTVRTRIRFFRRPSMAETVTVETFPEEAGKVRCNRDYRLRSGDELLAAGKTEWAILDTATGRPHPVQGVFPTDLEPEIPPVWDDPFSRIAEDFSGASRLADYTVVSTDIDIGGHMNNAAYIRALAGLFSTEAWNAMEIREMEVVYRAPCFAGSVIATERREIPGGMELRMSAEGKTVLLARILF